MHGVYDINVCIVFARRVPLQRRTVMRDARVVRAILEAKYNPGGHFSLPAFGDSPEPLQNYMDVSISLTPYVYNNYIIIGSYYSTVYLCLCLKSKVFI